VKGALFYRGSGWLVRVLAVTLLLSLWVPPSFGEEAARGDHVAPAREPSPGNRDLWNAGRELLEILEQVPPDQARLEQTLARINDIQLDLGISTLEYLPLVLCQKARLAIDNGNYQAARNMLAQAERINPQFVVTPFVRARLALAGNTPNPLGFVRHFTRGMVLFFQDFWGQRMLLGNALLTISHALLIFFFLFGAGLFLRELSRIIFDLTHFLPSDFNRAGVWILGFMVLFIPVWFGLGLLVCLAIWLILIWSYTNRLEKGIIIGLLVVMLLMPTLLSLAARQFLLYDNLPLHSAMYVMKGGWSDEVVEVLEEKVKNDPGDYRSHFYLGLLYKRKGGLEERINLIKAAASFERVLQLNRGHVPAQINLGNVYLYTNRPEAAREAYEKAMRMDPERASVYYNLSRFYFQNFKKYSANEGQSMYAKAQKINQEAISRQIDQFKEGSCNRETIDETLSTEEWNEIVAPQVMSLSVKTDLLWNSRLMGVPPNQLVVFVLGLGVLLFLVDYLRPRIWPLSKRCAMSGTPYVPTEEIRGPYCETTMNLFFKGDNVDLDARKAWKKYIARKELVNRVVTAIVTLLAPGLGHVMNEKPLVGTGLLAAWSLGIILCLRPTFLITLPLLSFSLAGVMPYVLFGILAAVLYFVSLATLWGEV
jgi:tetratricopeptide (TPR) repeat protein